MEESCCTCATLLENLGLVYQEKSEKPKAVERRLECCGRVICGTCIANNQRFATYCPYCQVTTIPSPLPQGLRDPPSYKVASASKPLPQHSVEPPPYSDVLPTYSSLTEQRLATPEKAFSSAVPADVLHFLDHENDSFTSLSFRYGVPISALRKANNVTSDHLLLARRTIVIPAEFYKGGVSLSPRPLEGEEEERRKGLVRRWMVACKVPEYDIAILYLNQADYDLNVAIEAYKKDERWGKEHPIEASVKGKGRRPDIGRRRFTGQR
ncbi:hypothetical protein JHW43_001238 [Diplocarpon mali]|nr:hypothetical protein JHW43_001238 [Diplocarpon mali]